MYIHEHDNWTDFRWKAEDIALPLDQAARSIGMLYGRLSGLGFNGQLQAMAENLTRDVVYSSEIEGIKLNADEVRSSIARKLGIENVRSTAPSHYIDGVVNVMLDAMEHYDQPLTKEKLCAWHSAFFPLGFSDGSQIEVGRYRTHDEVIVSGYLGREQIHYAAPSPERVEHEMKKFIGWFNTDMPIPSVIRSAIAHLWFVSIHPFEDGNGRMARMLGDICLVRGDKSHFRFYNISAEINRDKSSYYDILKNTQHGDSDITEWLTWYLRTVYAAVCEAETALSTVLNKSRFWLNATSIPMNSRQTATLNTFLDGYEAKITSKKWAELNKCSSDTALRDIKDLVSKQVLLVDFPEAKRPSYSINYSIGSTDIISMVADVKVIKEDDRYYITAFFRGTASIRERIQQLDAERFLRGDLPLEHLIIKYCSYLG